MAGKINSNISLMLGVDKSYQKVKYGWNRNHILQDLTGLEIQIYMKASNNKTGLKPEPKSSLQKNGINIPTS